MAQAQFSIPSLQELLLTARTGADAGAGAIRSAQQGFNQGGDIVRQRRAAEIKAQLDKRGQALKEKTLTEETRLGDARVAATTEQTKVTERASQRGKFQLEGQEVERATQLALVKSQIEKNKRLPVNTSGVKTQLAAFRAIRSMGVQTVKAVHKQLDPFGTGVPDINVLRDQKTGKITENGKAIAERLTQAFTQQLQAAEGIGGIVTKQIGSTPEELAAQVDRFVRSEFPEGMFTDRPADVQNFFSQWLSDIQEKVMNLALSGELNSDNAGPDSFADGIIDE